MRFVSVISYYKFHISFINHHFSSHVCSLWSDKKKKKGNRIAPLLCAEWLQPPTPLHFHSLRQQQSLLACQIV